MYELTYKVYEKYLGINLLQYIRFVYPNDSAMQQMRKDNILSTIQIHKDVSTMCNSIVNRYWQDRSIATAIKELRKNNDVRFEEEMEIFFPAERRSINWKERGNSNNAKQKNNRDRTFVGHLRWREGRFKKQKVYTKISH